MTKRVVIYGCMRSATLWLTDMLKLNVISSENKHITHETRGFKRIPLSEAFQMWNGEGLHIEVGYDGSIIEALYEQFSDLQVAVLVRDPVDHIISVINHTRVANVWVENDTGLLMAAAHYWGALELVLCTAKALGIDVKVWHFDYYTTPEGVTELAQSLGLNVQSPIEVRPPVNTARNAERLAITDYPEHTSRLLRQLQSRFTLAGPAYADAKVYADKRVRKSQ